ncbi:hypothetical protein [Streptomyces daliensis]|uniref:Uncharacterized protein n=1 Tax=Streptomyces daliensis TaxID=299421 RepID=A0A8T4ITG4_9ACTN|nr:hypothetical protein [Streptomyces daliensis]
MPSSNCATAKESPLSVPPAEIFRTSPRFSRHRARGPAVTGAAVAQLARLSLRPSS